MFSVQPFVVVTGVVESITARWGWPDVSTGSVEYTTGGAGWTAVGLPKAGWTAVGLPKACWTADELPKAGWIAVGLPNDTLLTTGWVELSRMWFRFLRVVLVFSVARMYDLGFDVLLMTVAGFHRPSWSRKRTAWPLWRGGRSRACWWCWYVILFCRSWSLSHFIVVLARVHDLCQKSRLCFTTIEELCRTWKPAVNRRCS